MDRNLVDQLEAQSEERVFDTGETILKKGSRADAFYVLVDGTIEILKPLPGGGSRVGSTIDAPAFLREMGLI